MENVIVSETIHFLRIEIKLWQIPKWKPFAKSKKRNIYRRSQIDLFFVNTNVNQSVRILSLTQSWVSVNCWLDDDVGFVDICQTLYISLFYLKCDLMEYF